jgi:NAD(P)-dependent dehydrogenase (short-subunit alcohol dehydrogenase family)
MELKDKKVLVTGGAVRIGREICRVLAAEGAHIIIHCHNSVEKAQSLASELGGHSVWRYELSKLEGLNEVFVEHGPIDVLINNAAIFNDKALAEETNEEFERQFTINFLAPLRLMKLFYQQKNLTSGNIINLLDQRVNKNDLTGGSYSLAKKTLAEATLTAASQWAPRIRVNGIAPGPVLPPPEYKGAGFQKVLEKVPLKKPVALNDLANSCKYLIENDSITGQLLFVDCGQHLY